MATIKKDMFTKDDLLTDLISNEGVCRTATPTEGLLKTFKNLSMLKRKTIIAFCISNSSNLHVYLSLQRKLFKPGVL